VIERCGETAFSRGDLKGSYDTARRTGAPARSPPGGAPPPPHGTFSGGAVGDIFRERTTTTVSGGIPLIPIRVTLIAALAALAACRDSAGTPATAALALRPTFAAGTNLDALGLVIDNVYLAVWRPATEQLLVERTVPFPTDAEEVPLAVAVPLADASEVVSVLLELRAGTQMLFFGGQDVLLQAGAAAGTPVDVPINYFGPGANVASLTILPRDTTVTTGDSVQFLVTAIDATQTPVVDFYAGWSTSDTLLGTIDATGLYRAPAVVPLRAGVRVRARTPTGVADSILVTFQTAQPAARGGTTPGGP
jgi:hypothetical protein